MIIPACIMNQKERNGLTVPAVYIQQEIFLQIPMDDLKYHYEVSNYGRVRVYKNNKYTFLSVWINYGYPNVDLALIGGGKRHVSVHRLVAMTFIPQTDPNKDIVNHIDCIRSNPYVGNLEWCTQLENIHHCIESGNFSYDTTFKKGEDHPCARLTEEQVHKICQLLQDTQCTIPYKDILYSIGMEDNDLNRGLIANIRNGKKWTHVSSQYNIPEKKKLRFYTDEEVETICQYLELGYSSTKIAEAMGFTFDTKKEAKNFGKIVSRIRNREKCPDISSKYKW